MIRLATLALLLLLAAFAQTDHTDIASQKTEILTMKMNAGIITPNIQETKQFYVENLGFKVIWEAEWFILLRTPEGDSDISFLLPGLESQAPIFQKPFRGEGLFLTVEVDDVDAWYGKFKDSGVEVAVQIRDEPWGDRHFAVIDPNGIGIDFVTHTPPEK